MLVEDIYRDFCHGPQTLNCYLMNMFLEKSCNTTHVIRDSSD